MQGQIQRIEHATFADDDAGSIQLHATDSEENRGSQSRTSRAPLEKTATVALNQYGNPEGDTKASINAARKNMHIAAPINGMASRAVRRSDANRPQRPGANQATPSRNPAPADSTIAVSSKGPCAVTNWKKFCPSVTSGRAMYPKAAPR
jgi:hypothetical protein